MKNKSRLMITFIIFLSFAANAVAQYEPDWPEEGYTAYFSNNGNSVLIRDEQDNCTGKMTLTTPWLAQSNNIAASFLYEEKHGVRWEYIDANKNGVIDTIFYEDFSPYEHVDNPDLPPLPCPYNVYGTQSKGKGLSNGLLAYFDTEEPEPEDPEKPETIPPYAPVTIIGDEFDTQLNFKDAYILLDLKTEGIYEPVEQVLTPAVRAKVLYNPLVSPKNWHLQNYSYQLPARNNPSCLYPLPASQNSTIAVFDVNDLLIADGASSSSMGDFRYVSGISIFLLQTALDSTDIQNDWDEQGSIKINRIQVSKDLKLNSSNPLDTQVIVSNIQADSFQPGNKVTVSLDIFKKGTVTETITDIAVFDSTFDFTNVEESKIYDSSAMGDSIETHIGLGEIETVNFSFYLPQDAPQGSYKVFAVIKDNQDNILDTTGPDSSLNDSTILAYTDSFTVSPFTQEGPVPLFDYSITEQDNENVSLNLSAEMSFNYSSQNDQIVNYEWDLDNDGSFEYQSGSPTQQIVFTSVTDSFVKPVALRVTNNHDPAQTGFTSKLIRIGRIGNLEIDTSLVDNNSIANAKCFLYDSEHNYIGQKIVASSSTALWQNITVGDYIVEVYVYKNNMFPSVELACSEEVTVSAGTTSSYTVSQPVFSILAAQMYYADTDVLVDPDIKLFPGTNIKLDITLQNNSSYDLYARTKLVIDKDQSELVDIDINLSDKTFVPTGQQATVSTFFTPKVPEHSGDTYYYAFMIEAEKNLIPIKVHEQGWQTAYSENKFPSRRVMDKINFCGHDFDVIRVQRFSGLSDKNVWFSQPNDNEGDPSTPDPKGILNIKVQDYSGVGGETTSPYEQYHYGVYKAELKVDGQATTLPEGTVAGFFYYWQYDGENQLQEIDVELRSLDKTKKGISSYVAFSVHSRKGSSDRSRVVTHYCPVENIDEYHTYEFRWKTNEVAFYIDGLPAYNFNGERAVVNDQSIDINGDPFTGRIPTQPGRLIMNHWSGYWNNTWSGAPPQGKGDSIFKIARIAYTPLEEFNNTEAINIVKTQYNKIELKLKQGSWPLGCDIYSTDLLSTPLEWQLIEENVSLTDKNGYIDNSSSNNSLKYYKVIPK